MRRTFLTYLVLTICLAANARQIHFAPPQSNAAAASTSDAPTTSSTWQTTRGTWTHNANTITAQGNFDNRAINPTAYPQSLRWPVTIDLQEGWSAGALIWSEANGQNGYAVRLDSRKNILALEKIGPWPEVNELDSFPWTLLDGLKVSLLIETTPNSIRVTAPDISKYAILEATDIKPAGPHVGLQLLDSRATFSDAAPSPNDAAAPIKRHKPKVGEYTHVYNSSVGENEPWYINDHTFIKADDGWHLVGITHAHPANPLDELNFAHAKSPEFPGSQDTWKKQPYALETDQTRGEALLWAPHIIKRDNLYYMFYCAGSPEGGAHFQINLATSEDCTSWTRYEKNPVFQDTFDARDPMIMEDDGTYYMYYTANMGRNDSNHTVHLRTSKDLLNWSPARIVFVHPQKGTWGGETESPFVVKYGDHFYLFIGPARAYHSTAVYRSSNPLHWRFNSEITSFPSHAAEVIHENNNWYVSGAGWDREGVFVAPMEWEPDNSTK